MCQKKLHHFSFLIRSKNRSNSAELVEVSNLLFTELRPFWKFNSEWLLNKRLCQKTLHHFSFLIGGKDGSNSAELVEVSNLLFSEFRPFWKINSESLWDKWLSKKHWIIVASWLEVRTGQIRQNWLRFQISFLLNWDLFES